MSNKLPKVKSKIKLTDSKWNKTWHNKIVIVNKVDDVFFFLRESDALGGYCTAHELTNLTWEYVDKNSKKTYLPEWF